MKPFPEMLKKEQIVVVLLAGILLLIIAMPVKKKDTEEQTAKSTPTSEARKPIMRTSFSSGLRRCWLR